MADGRQTWEIRTEQLSIDQLRAKAEEIQHLLRQWRLESVRATLGYGCAVPSDLVWKPVEVGVAHLGTLIQEYVKDGFFQFGECDLHIEDMAEILEFAFATNRTSTSRARARSV